ncbi:hypothetical protein D3C80_1221110 [compost metagenome]
MVLKALGRHDVTHGQAGTRQAREAENHLRPALISREAVQSSASNSLRLLRVPLMQSQLGAQGKVQVEVLLCDELDGALGLFQASP